MTRRHVCFSCEGDQLVGTLDPGSASTGLLIVSGGNEIRSGAFGGQSLLARSFAAKGYPVFRFDRRGVGDSAGDNRGFRSSAPDIAAALTEFRRLCPDLARIVAFGNCDAASALVLSRGTGCDALILSNPWTFDDASSDHMPSGETIRSRYADKLRNPGELKRLLTGKVNLSGVLQSLGKALRGGRENSELGMAMQEAIASLAIPVTILIAGNDRTGQAFVSSWTGSPGAFLTCQGASHAYVEPHAHHWLEVRIVEALEA